jgi:hypothetical protein
VGVGIELLEYWNNACLPVGREEWNIGFNNKMIKNFLSIPLFQHSNIPSLHYKGGSDGSF